MLGRLIAMLLIVALTVTILLLAVANRQEVRLILDATNRDNPAIYLSVPLSIFILQILALGAFLGVIASWISQGKWRKAARQRALEAMRWKVEVERLPKERDENVTG